MWRGDSEFPGFVQVRVRSIRPPPAVSFLPPLAPAFPAGVCCRTLRAMTLVAARKGAFGPNVAIRFSSRARRNPYGNCYLL